MESSPVSIGVESSQVSNEVDYSTNIDPKNATKELNNIGNTEKDVCGIIVENVFTIENEKYMHTLFI